MFPSPSKPPHPFSLLRTGKVTLWVHPSARDRVAELLKGHTSLYEGAKVASLAHSGEPLHGRGPLHLVSGVEHGERWAVRHFYRGGILAPLLGDRYFRSWALPRPLAEAVASERCRKRGIPTPQIMAAASYGHGFTYRGDLITRYIPESATLARLLVQKETDSPSSLNALELAGSLARRLAATGILHPDLNVKNILLSPVPEPREVHLLDLDRVRISAGHPVSGTPMFRRLTRSLRKWERQSPHPLSRSAWAALTRGWKGDVG